MKAALRPLLGGLGYQVQGVRYTPRQRVDPANLRAIQFDAAGDDVPAVRF